MAHIDHAPQLHADPYANANPGTTSAIAEVEGLRARHVRLDRGTAVPWHVKPDSRTMVYAHSDGLAVQIRKPPFKNTLKRGEHYTVPPNVAMSVYAADGCEIDFTVFEYGNSLAALAVDPPSLDYVIERSRASGEQIQEALHDEATDYASFAAGFSRMDVIAAPPGLRLIFQGHGVRECVPWHSHDNIADTFFCVKGTLRIATRSPERVVELAPGDVHEVAAGVPHFVSGLGGTPCEVLILQGVGTYNYVQQ
ncbi:cupin domain-containing protein [Variovorax sp. PBS-H4]|uniref:cupin domain-containing protein n=1 Tax=Variovorax sp. PBS-H4 TaxID=434008 RepID=UPI0013A5B674|nr:cupin domain-containing protein [Variovorax sp. PBS-H4]